MRLMGPLVSGKAGARPPRRWAIAALVALMLASCVALTASVARAESSPTVLPADPVLARLIEESLAARPELARAEAVVHAQQERIPQEGALPDPMLQVGIQNDGFTSIEIGRMETSFVSLMASQTFPWPGKRGLRREVATLGAAQATEAVGGRHAHPVRRRQGPAVGPASRRARARAHQAAPFRARGRGEESDPDAEPAAQPSSGRTHRDVDAHPRSGRPVRARRSLLSGAGPRAQPRACGGASRDDPRGEVHGPGPEKLLPGPHGGGRDHGPRISSADVARDPWRTAAGVLR
jgi:hypothetical protein